MLINAELPDTYRIWFRFVLPERFLNYSWGFVLGHETESWSRLASGSGSGSPVCVCLSATAVVDLNRHRTRWTWILNAIPQITCCMWTLNVSFTKTNTRACLENKLHINIPKSTLEYDGKSITVRSMAAPKPLTVMALFYNSKIHTNHSLIFIKIL